MRSLGYRARMLSKKERGDDVVDAVLDGEIPEELVSAARDIFRDKLVRLYVESSLLASDDIDSISELLDIPSPVLKLYHDLYFCVHPIGKIHRLSYLNTITDQSEAQMKRWAIAAGLDFIKWRMGLMPDYDRELILQQLCADAVYRSREAFFSGNTAAASKEARQWSRHASLLIKQLESAEPEVDDAANQLILELDRITEESSEIPSIEDLMK